MLIGRDAREIEAKEFGFDAETVKWLSARREEAASTDRPLHFERELQYPRGAFVGEFTITPVRDAEATVRHLLITERDLTKLRRTEEYDRRTREQVTQAQKMEALGKLARGIAHDFNNLLTGVLGFAELATASNSLEEARSHAGQVVGIALRARDLVWQILTYSRPKSSRDPVMVTTIVRDMITLLSATLPKSILLQTHLAEPGPKVVIDPSQLQQVILNLCTNAAHAMPDGGELTLAVEEVYLAADFCADHPPAAPGRYAHLRVADTGSGMPPEVVRRVFEPFFTTKPLGRGTGLGLAVVHSIVAEIKGLVTLDSEVGRGTTFDVYFPTAGSGEQPRPATPPPVGSGERVLCVDNDPALIDLLTRVLHELNYIPIGFTDTARALAAFAADPAAFDLVMTNAEVHSSPGESLAEALRRIRGNIPVLLVSGAAKAPPPALADIVILAKPYSREQIAEALKAALARR
ncbi:MAG: ATP-binding protein [Fimbriiglobus sp.]|nr:ATP-binding protein [Fimbriiglobus sp.]